MSPPWPVQLETLLHASHGALVLRWLRLRHPGLSLPPGTRVEPGVVWRLAPEAQVVLRPGCHVRRGVEFKADARAAVSIGARVHIGPWSTLSALESLEVGDDCLIAEGVSIRDHDHAIESASPPYANQGYRVAPVRLGANVWLGARVTVVKGVTLGDGCVVAAGAVVTRSFPAGSLIAGVPGRWIRQVGTDAAGQGR